MSGLLRLCTAGSVDDGKSTLIGRLLHDAKAVYEDQILSVKHASATRTAGPIDYSLFTDGLKAEREQGITIDVAYRYFATARRKFILADTPGHEQYTRNMATGASTADLAVLLVDARHGLRPQTHLHARIVRLLGISQFVLAVNKMDLVDFDRDVFERIREDFRALAGEAAVHAIPLSALGGDNVITRSARTPWFDGHSLLDHLETVPIDRDVRDKPLRFPVQLVVRGGQGFRGYAGQLQAGSIRPGDRVTIWPSGAVACISRIVTWEGDLPVAEAPLSVTLTLDRDLDVGRGDLIVAASAPPHVSSRFDADLVWMDERPADPARIYLLKHGTRTVTAELDRALVLNEIQPVVVTAARPLAFDRYAETRATGSFIIVDPATQFTAGAGMILNPIDEGARADHRGAAARLAQLARTATTDRAAADAVREALEEMFS